MRKITALIVIIAFIFTQCGIGFATQNLRQVTNAEAGGDGSAAAIGDAIGKTWSKGFKEKGKIEGTINFAQARTQEYLAAAFTEGRAFAITGHGAQNVKDIITNYENKSKKLLSDEEKEILLRSLANIKKFINKTVRENVSDTKSRNRLIENTRIVVILDEEGKPFLYEEGIAGTDSHKYLAALGGNFAYEGSEKLRREPRSIYLSLAQVKDLMDMGSKGQQALCIEIAHIDRDLQRRYHTNEPAEKEKLVSDVIKKSAKRYGLQQLQESIKNAKDFIGDGAEVSENDYKKYLKQVDEIFSSLVELSTPDTQLQRTHKQRVNRIFSKISSKKDFTRTRHNELENLLIALSKDKAGDRKLLESAALCGELIDIALVLSLTANITSENQLWIQLNNFFNSTIDYSIESVRTKIQTSVDFSIGYNETAFGREKNQEADELFLRTHMWLNDYSHNLISARTGVSLEYLTQVCTIGNESVSTDEEFALEYFRLFEIARLRRYGYPLPERIEENFDPQSTEFSNRSNIGIIYRWGHTQMTFVNGANDRSTTNVVLVPDNANNIEIVNDQYSGEKIVQIHSALFYDNEGLLTLAKFRQPVRLDAAVVPPRHSLLPKLQSAGIPMPWSAKMYEICNNKAIYSEIFPESAGENVFYYPKQVAFGGTRVSKTDILREVKRFIANIGRQNVSAIKVIVKPTDGSGGRDILTHEINLKKPELSGLVEDIYQARKKGNVIMQRFARSPPLDEVANADFLMKARKTLKQKRQNDGKPFDEKIPLRFGLRTIATRTDSGAVVNARVILVNDSDIVSMTQGAVMFLLDENVFDSDKMPADLVDNLEKASFAVMKRVNEFAKQKYGETLKDRPLDGGSYLNVDNLLLDWAWDGDRLALAHIEFNIGLGSFWYHSELLKEAGLDPNTGIGSFLDILESRSKKYNAALEEKAHSRYAYDSAKARQMIVEHGEANLATREAQRELYNVIENIDMDNENSIVSQRCKNAKKEDRLIISFIGGLGFAGTGLFALFGDAKEITDLEEVRKAASRLSSLKGISKDTDTQIDKIIWLLRQNKVKRAKLFAELKKLEDMAGKLQQSSFAKLKTKIQEKKSGDKEITENLRKASQAAADILVTTNNMRQTAKNAPSKNLYAVFPIQRVFDSRGKISASSSKIITTNEGIFPFDGENDELDKVLASAHKEGTVWASPSRESIAEADLVMSTLRLDIVRLPAEIEDVAKSVNDMQKLLSGHRLTEKAVTELREKVSTLNKNVKKGKDDIRGLVLSPQDRTMLIRQLDILNSILEQRTVRNKRSAILKELEVLQWSIQKITQEAEGIFGPTFPEIKLEIDEMAPYFARNIETRKKEGREKPTFFIVTTQAPGVCMHILRMMLEERLSELGYDYKAGRDFYFGFNPSRVTPGRNWQRSINRMPHIVGGMTKEDSKVMKRHLEAIVMDEIHEYGTPDTAELHKTFENTWRDLVIAASNLLALYADFLGTADAWEILSEIDKRPTHNPLSPGFVAGYCLYKDPWFLEWASRYLEKLKKSGHADEFTARDTMTLEAIVEFTQLFREERDINRFMSYYASALVMHGIEKSGISKSDARVLISGIRYLDIPIPDTRNSGAEHIVAGLISWLKELERLPGWAQKAYHKTFERTGHLTAKNITLFDPYVQKWSELERHAEKDGGEWAELYKKYHDEPLFVTLDEKEVKKPEDEPKIIAKKAREKAWEAVNGQDVLVFVLEGHVEHQELVSNLPKLYATMRNKVIVDLRNVMKKEKVQEWLALGGIYIGMGKGEFLVDNQLRGEMELKRENAGNLLAALENQQAPDTIQGILDELSEGTNLENIPLEELTFDRWLTLGGNYYVIGEDMANIKETLEQGLTNLTQIAEATKANSTGGEQLISLINHDFERVHTEGVVALASLFVERLKEQNEYLSDEDILLLETAGWAHDLGYNLVDLDVLRDFARKFKVLGLKISEDDFDKFESEVRQKAKEQGIEISDAEYEARRNRRFHDENSWKRINEELAKGTISGPLAQFINDNSENLRLIISYHTNPRLLPAGTSPRIILLTQILHMADSVEASNSRLRYSMTSPDTPNTLEKTFSYLESKRNEGNITPGLYDLARGLFMAHDPELLDIIYKARVLPGEPALTELPDYDKEFFAPLGDVVKLSQDEIVNHNDAANLISGISNDKPVLVITVAGLGRRYGDEPKCIQHVGGKPVARHSIDAADENGFGAKIAIVNYKQNEVMRALGDGNIYVHQDDPAGGTAYAVFEAFNVTELLEKDPILVITYGDKVMTPEIFKQMLKKHYENGEEAAITFLTAEYENGKHMGKGRILRNKNDNQVIKIIEQPDINAMVDDGIDQDSGLTKEQLNNTTEGNCPFYIIRAKRLFELLGSLTKFKNSQKQYYFTDIVQAIREENGIIRTITITPQSPDYTLLTSDVTVPADRDRLDAILTDRNKQKVVATTAGTTGYTAAATTVTETTEAGVQGVRSRVAALSADMLEAESKWGMATRGGLWKTILEISEEAKAPTILAPSVSRNIGVLATLSGLTKGTVLIVETEAEAKFLQDMSDRWGLGLKTVLQAGELSDAIDKAITIIQKYTPGAGYTVAIRYLYGEEDEAILKTGLRSKRLNVNNLIEAAEVIGVKAVDDAAISELQRALEHYRDAISAV